MPNMALPAKRNLTQEVGVQKFNITKRYNVSINCNNVSDLTTKLHIKLFDLTTISTIKACNQLEILHSTSKCMLREDQARSQTREGVEPTCSGLWGLLPRATSVIIKRSSVCRRVRPIPAKGGVKPLKRQAGKCSGRTLEFTADPRPPPPPPPPPSSKEEGTGRAGNRKLCELDEID